MEAHEFELGEHELGEHEVAHELAEHEAEAEALAGAAATITLSRRDHRALRALVPNLVRGAAILTRVLRMRRATRPFVRVVPTNLLRRRALTARAHLSLWQSLWFRSPAQRVKDNSPALQCWVRVGSEPSPVRDDRNRAPSRLFRP